MDISERLLKGEKRALSRAISAVESNYNGYRQLLNTLHKQTGNAYRIGITGPPGAGKSTITNYITLHYLKQNKKVGIIAVDPTSPFSGGALLGDRVRMNELNSLDDVFIRSMATRGSLGGLSRKTIDSADLIDAAGYDVIIFETVGVGQSELDIASVADTTVVVLVPESGDSVQAMKAGLMEIGDVFALNKCDRPGSESAYMALKTILGLKYRNENEWIPPILKLTASENKGIPQLVNLITDHHKYMIESNTFSTRRIENYRKRLEVIVNEYLSDELWSQIDKNKLNTALHSLISGELSPHTLADSIISEYKRTIK